MDVLRVNLELFKRPLGLEQVEVLLPSDVAAFTKADEHVLLLEKNLPSPGDPVAIFLSK